MRDVYPVEMKVTDDNVLIYVDHGKGEVKTVLVGTALASPSPIAVPTAEIIPLQTVSVLPLWIGCYGGCRPCGSPRAVPGSLTSQASSYSPCCALPIAGRMQEWTPFVGTLTFGSTSNIAGREGALLCVSSIVFARPPPYSYLPLLWSSLPSDVAVIIAR